MSAYKVKQLKGKGLPTLGENPDSVLIGLISY